MPTPKHMSQEMPNDMRTTPNVSKVENTTNLLLECSMVK